MTIDPTELARLKLAAKTKLHFLERASGIVSGLMSVRPEQVLALIAEVERLQAAVNAGHIQVIAMGRKGEP